MSDLLDELPIDNSAISYEEEARINPLMSSESAGGFFVKHKRQLIATVLFLILALPIIDSLFLKITGNAYLGAIIKAIVFGLLLYILNKLI